MTETEKASLFLQSKICKKENKNYQAINGKYNEQITPKEEPKMQRERRQAKDCSEGDWGEGNIGNSNK